MNPSDGRMIILVVYDRPTLDEFNVGVTLVGREEAD